MLPPLQNQDLLQRSDTMSEMRSAEQGKAFGNIIKSTAEMQRLEELKNNSVQKDDESEAVNPDGKGGGQEGQNKKKQQEEEAKPETNTPAGHPIKLEGGDILDIMA
jgi:hypothetical protein